MKDLSVILKHGINRKLSLMIGLGFFFISMHVYTLAFVFLIQQIE